MGPRKIHCITRYLFCQGVWKPPVSMLKVFPVSDIEPRGARDRKYLLLCNNGRDALYSFNFPFGGGWGLRGLGGWYFSDGEGD